MKQGDTVFVNLYIPSEVKEGQMYLEQNRISDTSYTFRINAKNTEVAFRVPGWADNFRIIINDMVYEQPAEQDRYIHIRRDWDVGDNVEAVFEYKLRSIASPDDRDYVSLTYGPYILAEISEEETYRSVSDLSKVDVKDTLNGLEVIIEDRRFISLEAVTNEKYHVYFKDREINTGRTEFEE